MKKRYSERCKKTELCIWLKNREPWILSLPGVRDMLEELPALHKEVLQDIRQVIVDDPDGLIVLFTLLLKV